VIAIPSAAAVPAAAVEVVANRAAPIGESTRRVRTHRTAAQGVAAHALIRDSLEVGTREFSSTAGKPTGAEVPRRTAVERASAVEPTATVERTATVDSPALNDAIAAEVAGTAQVAVATEVTTPTKITAAEIPSAKVAATSAKVAATAAKVTAAAAKVTSAAPVPSTTHPAATATSEATAAMAATPAAVRQCDRGRHHLADDRSRYDHCSKPTCGPHRPMHRMFSGTGYGHEQFTNEPTRHQRADTELSGSS
jgi:hypothetical protein